MYANYRCFSPPIVRKRPNDYYCDIYNCYIGQIVRAYDSLILSYMLFFRNIDRKKERFYFFKLFALNALS